MVEDGSAKDGSGMRLSSPSLPITVTTIFRRWEARRVRKENSLPGSQAASAPPQREWFRWLRVSTMRICDGMSSAPSESCSKIVGVLRHQPIEKFFEIAPRRGISILHHDQAATGVLRENCNNAVFNFALAHKRFDFVGDFVGAFARSRDGENSW